MSGVALLRGLEILDSRGRPTVRVTCRLVSGATGSASVPSGASTGRAEAVELRDGDPTRYEGLGCRRAVEAVHGPIARSVCGARYETQAELDAHLIALDGTDKKQRLGANALLATSIAFARAQALERGRPLYRHLTEDGLPGAPSLPRLSINLFSGGKHAGGQVAVQDVLVVPHRGATVAERLAVTSDVYRAATALILDRYAMRALVADEGGLAPPFPSSRAMLTDAVDAIERAGYVPGIDVGLAVDVAASHFAADGRYLLDGRVIGREEMVDEVARWCSEFPLVSVEDPLAEDDWEGWAMCFARLRGRVLVVGDDLLCTDPARIRRATSLDAADALLLKPNQVGTLTEARQAAELARAAGWSVIASARSGETEDDWLADLAVGWGADFIKVGSITRSERLAKYNRLLEIENALGARRPAGR